MANPKLTLSLTGSGVINQKTIDRTWTPSVQIERIYKLKNSDGDQVIELSDIDNIKLIYISSENGNFVVKTTIGANIISEETNLYILTPTSDYVATIDSFEISTLSTSDITIDLRVYGQS